MVELLVSQPQVGTPMCRSMHPDTAGPARRIGSVWSYQIGRMNAERFDILFIPSTPPTLQALTKIQQPELNLYGRNDNAEEQTEKNPIRKLFKVERKIMRQSLRYEHGTKETRQSRKERRCQRKGEKATPKNEAVEKHGLAAKGSRWCRRATHLDLRTMP